MASKRLDHRLKAARARFCAWNKVASPLGWRKQFGE
jgi:hypothetical protein